MVIQELKILDFSLSANQSLDNVIRAMMGTGGFLKLFNNNKS